MLGRDEVWKTYCTRSGANTKGIGVPAGRTFGLNALNDQVGFTTIVMIVARFDGLIHFVATDIDDASLFAHIVVYQVVETTTIRKGGFVVVQVLRCKELDFKRLSLNDPRVQGTRE